MNPATVRQHRPPPITFTVESVIQGLRFAAAHEPGYVRRGARAALNRILGPGWRPWPSPRPADPHLSPERRTQFHLHPVPTLDEPDALPPYGEESLEDDDEYW